MADATRYADLDLAGKEAALYDLLTSFDLITSLVMGPEGVQVAYAPLLDESLARDLAHRLVSRVRPIDG